MTGLATRLATSAVLVPLFVATIVAGGVVFLGAILVLVLVGTLEFFHLAGDKPYRARLAPGVALALAFPVILYWAPGAPWALAALLTAGVIATAALQMLDPRGAEALASTAFTIFGALYVGLLFGHLVVLREIGREGAVLLGFTLLLTWIDDTAAYFVGRRWGRRRLLPRVSPSKSLEGAIGAGLVTLLAALIAWAVAGELVPAMELADAAAIGVLVAIAAPVGDLIESAFKRDAGVKDVSRLIPGHGGVLDRFDSALVTVPLVTYYLLGFGL